MSNSLENWADQLEWFFSAYPKSHRIKLSFAHHNFERTLGRKIDPAKVFSILKKKKYSHIIIDLDIVEKKESPILNTIINNNDPTKLKESIDIDNIDDILNTPLEPMQPSLHTSQKQEITHAMNEHLLREYERTKNKKFLDNLVAGNMKLVYSVALRYKNYMNHDLTEEDLIQEGVFGLIVAIERFDHSLGYSLSTYATHWIRQRIIRSIINYGTIVRIPVNMVEQIRSLKKAEANLIRQFGENVPITKICVELNISMEKYYELKQIEHQFLAFTSLNQYVGNEDDTELQEFVPNDRLEIFSSLPEEFADPSEVVERKLLRETIVSLLDRLKPKEKLVIEYRFGLNDNRERTLEEVGLLIGVTRERIRQIEARALARLNILLGRET